MWDDYRYINSWYTYLVYKSISDIIASIVLNFYLFFSSHYQWTPLHLAAGQSNEEIVKYLVNKRADINIKNKAGVSIGDYTLWRFCSSTFYFRHSGKFSMGANVSYFRRLTCFCKNISCEKLN